MSSSHDEISSDDEMFPDRPLMPWMIGGPAGAPTHNLDDNYHDWKDPIDPKDPDELTLSTFVASAQRNDKNADQEPGGNTKNFTLLKYKLTLLKHKLTLLFKHKHELMLKHKLALLLMHK